MNSDDQLIEAAVISLNYTTESPERTIPERLFDPTRVPHAFFRELYEPFVDLPNPFRSASRYRAGARRAEPTTSRLGTPCGSDRKGDGTWQRGSGCDAGGRGRQIPFQH